MASSTWVASIKPNGHVSSACPGCTDCVTQTVFVVVTWSADIPCSSARALLPTRMKSLKCTLPHRETGMKMDLEYGIPEDLCTYLFWNGDYKELYCHGHFTVGRFCLLSVYDIVFPVIYSTGLYWHYVEWLCLFLGGFWVESWCMYETSFRGVALDMLLICQFITVWLPSTPASSLCLHGDLLSDFPTSGPGMELAFV